MDKTAQKGVAQTFRRISGWRSAELTPSIATARSELVLPRRSDLPDPLTAESDYEKALAKVNGQMWWMRSERPLSGEEKRAGEGVRGAWERWRAAPRGRREAERKKEVSLGQWALCGRSRW